MSDDTPTPESFPAWSVQTENYRLRELVRLHEELETKRGAEIATLQKRLEDQRNDGIRAIQQLADAVIAAEAENARLRSVLESIRAARDYAAIHNLLAPPAETDHE